jgi:23S rRNA (adenine2503-C2)-methyltransferase
MVGQVLTMARQAGSFEGEAWHDPAHVVLMGMGEPFLNYDQVIRALKILISPWGFGLSARRITVSTVGIVPEIYRFSRDGGQVNLAISLHAASDALRSRLLPINRIYPLSMLIAAVCTYLEKTHRRVTFEYVMLEGVNTRRRDAERLVRLLEKVHPCHVNLIPFNPVPGTTWKAPTGHTIRSFTGILNKGGIANTVRASQGVSIDAACGQLAGRLDL